MLLFVSESYPAALIDETNDEVTGVKYKGEPARILLYLTRDDECSGVIVKLSQDLSKSMSVSNGREYIVDTIDAMNKMRFALRVIMDMKAPESARDSMPLKKQAGVGEGYLMNRKNEMVGVVDLSKIPQSFLKKGKEDLKSSMESAPEKRNRYGRFFS